MAGPVKTEGRDRTDGDLKVNVGCGATPTEGFLNFDNSFTLRTAGIPLLYEVLFRLGLVSRQQYDFRKTAAGRVEYADAVKLPVPDNSCSVVYSSHMLEHLDRERAALFLAEARRSLKPGGVLRLGVPDLRKFVEAYVQNGDADEFVQKTLLAASPLRGVMSRVRLLCVGFRHHQWMYDANSLIRLVESAGFDNVSALPPGSTLIPDPGGLNLREREGESVYVEGIKPAASL